MIDLLEPTVVGLGGSIIKRVVKGDLSEDGNMLKLVGKSVPAVGSLAKAIIQYKKGQALDSDMNPMNRTFGAGDAVMTTLFGDPLKDIQAKDELFYTGTIKSSPAARMREYSKLFATTGLEYPKSNINKLRDAIKDDKTERNIRLSILQTEGKFRKVEKKMNETSNDMLKKFLEQSGEKLAILGAKNKTEEEFGFNVDYKQYKTTLKSAIKRYIDTEKNKEILNNISSAINISSTYTNRYDKLRIGGKTLGSYPIEERPYWYMLYTVMSKENKIQKQGEKLKYDELFNPSGNLNEGEYEEENVWGY
jgi:hypothetical protein